MNDRFDEPESTRLVDVPLGETGLHFQLGGRHYLLAIEPPDGGPTTTIKISSIVPAADLDSDAGPDVVDFDPTLLGGGEIVIRTVSHE